MPVGTFLLIVCMATNLIALLCYIFAAPWKRTFLSIARSAYYGMTVAVLMTSVYLMTLILNHRFDIDYVWSYSSKDLPLTYLLSAFWAGQEGSFLLWALFASLMGLLLAVKSGDYEPWLMAFWCAVQAFFLTILLAKSPFLPTAPQALANAPNGQGLNPLLQNFWMAIHPPLVFLGYAAMTAPAAFVVPALIRRDYKTWANRCLPWAIFGWLTLGAGIIIGSYWAYEVLGWGGYWGWDPVENASLVPWVAGTALLHGMLVERYRGSMRRTNMFLASMAFMLVIYAAFLTRSGVLSNVSVHSFANEGLNPYLLGFMGFFGLVFFGLLLWRAWEAKSEPWYGDLKSKEFAFFVGIISLCMLAVFVLIGITIPVFTTRLNVGQEYYGSASAPIAVVLLIVLALVPSLPWTRKSSAEGASPASKQLRITAIAIGLSALAAVSSALAIGVAKAALVAIGAIAFIVFLINVGQVKQYIRGNWKMIGGHLAHVGVALMFIGMVFSPSNRKPLPVTMPQGGQPVKALGYSFSFLGLSPRSDGGATFKVKVERDGKSFVATPAFRAGTGGEMMGLPHIKWSPFQDLYIAPAAYRPLEIEPSKAITQKGAVIGYEATPDGGVEVGLMAVGENQSALLLVREPGKQPIGMEIARGQSKKFGKYTFTFNGFEMLGGHEQAQEMKMSAKLGVTYPGATPSAVIDVSLKPLISLIWLGAFLALLGGGIAIMRRVGENRKILPAADEEPTEAK